MVCSCVVPSKRVLLQVIFCSCIIETTLSRETWQMTSDLSCQEVIKTMKTNLVIECLNSCWSQLSQIIIHQIFSLARDWSKHITRPSILLLKLGKVREYSPTFKTARVAKKIWKIIKTIASIWGENMLGYLSLDIIRAYFRAKWWLLFIYIMMVKPMKTLESHYPMIQFLIKVDIHISIFCFFWYCTVLHCTSLCCKLITILLQYKFYWHSLKRAFQRQWFKN